nr:immunoglobulin heavy chain junction region [Macaca mulatta]MOX60423.1 immunoglobulin heavy chain junction region [Macaca mulatta]MOX61039.1 immunoglobulin heavy chain junction region [Macaca mulatta]MOX61379.1 immunoglobulin heavy chain junction region [Macaca mulatta]MOX62781.1 immunoglobulin heavy chain junction region [Macaca mulatta]
CARWEAADFDYW